MKQGSASSAIPMTRSLLICSHSFKMKSYYAELQKKLLFVGCKFHNVRYLTLQNVAEIIQSVQGNAAVLTKRIKRTGADSVILYQAVLTDPFFLQSIPERFKSNHLRSPHKDFTQLPRD